MKLLFIVSLCFLSTLVCGQPCDCSSQLAFTIQYYEQNNPAFQKLRSNAATYKTYLKQVEKIKADARNQSALDQCILQLDQYVALLKDHHSEMSFNLKRMDLSTPENIAAFKQSARYKGYRKIKIDTAQLVPLLSSKKPADIEGIYSNGGSVVFGIIQNDKNPNNYLGVVLKEHKLLDVGHILLELNRRAGDRYNVTYHIGLLGFNFEKILKMQKIENGLMPAFGFFKTRPAATGKEYEFRSLNDSTNYIMLRSFDGSLSKDLDSFYSAIEAKIKARPYLVVDIRNNSGGAERSYFGLLPYAYTRPLQLDAASVWVSPQNIKRYEETSAGNNASLLQRMKAARPFSFISQTEDTMTTWALDSGTVYPKKIALLYNRGTASAGEGMILYFMQSDKVITIGENSGGYIGYGNVMIAQTPCEQFTIRSTTTRYDKKSAYEFIGIEPMYKPAKTQDWVRYAEELLPTIKR